MPEPFVSGTLATNASISGPVKMADVGASVKIGYEIQPNGFYFGTKIGTGEQRILNNSKTGKDYDPKLYTTLGAVGGYNMAAPGFFANAEQSYRGGAGHQSGAYDFEGTIANVNAGMRLLNNQEVGFGASSVTYASKGLHRDANYYRANIFANTYLNPNLKLGLETGVENHWNKSNTWKPEFGVNLSYTIPAKK